MADRTIIHSYWYECQVSYDGKEVKTKQGTMSAATPADALEKLEEKAKRDWRATLYTTKLSSLSGKDTIVQMQYESTKELESEEEEEAANEPFDRSVDGANMDAWASRFEGQGVYPILKLEETQGANKQ